MGVSTDDYLRYLRLNETLNSILFDGRFDNIPVYIDIEGDLKTEICNKLGLDECQFDEYVGEVVSDTLDWTGRGHLYDWHEGKLKNEWTVQSENPPPFTALLLAFSVAAENMRADEAHSSTNFYGRAAEIFGEKASAKVLSDNSSKSQIFWDDLNLWLKYHDFCFGRPTAEPVYPKWKYASFAMSQALVRRSDRDCFHKLFEKYHLSHSDQISIQEISSYLESWIISHDSTKFLQRIWKTKSLRPRIIDAVVEELNQWSSAGTIDSKGFSQGRLEWKAKFKYKFPGKPTFFPLLCVRGLDVDSSQDYFLCASDFEKNEKSVIAESLRFNYIDGLNDSFSVGPTASLSMENLLSSFLLLKNNLGDAFSRQYKAIIPFVREDFGCYIREVSRLPLYSPSFILCHVGWKPQIISFLNDYAKENYKVLDDTNSGMPLGWCLFYEVEMVVIPDLGDINRNLQDIVPSKDSIYFNISGGLKIDRNIWHRLAPPQIFAINEGKSASISVTEAGLGAELIIQADDSVASPSFLYNDGYSILAARENEDFCFRILGSESEREISFRSADNPKKHLPNSDWKLSYSVVSDQDQLEWLGASYGQKNNFLMGLETSTLGENYTVALPAVNRRLLFVDSYEASVLDLYKNETYKSEDSLINGQSCLKRGSHTWYVPEDATSKTKKVTLICTVCGVNKTHRGAPSKKKNNIHRNYLGSSVKLEPNRNDPPVSHDLILDALGFRGAASVSKLYEWFSLLATVNEPWDAHNAIKDYVDLGYIDVDIDPISFRIKHWSISPATFVINESGVGFLAGFRSRKLVSEVSQILQEFDLSISEKFFENQPTKYECLIPQYIRKEVIDRLSGCLTVTENPALKILGYLPELNFMIKKFKEASPSSTGLKKFDTSSAKWQECENTLSPGAYYNDHFARYYFFVDALLISRLMPYEVAKIAAAKNNGLRLHDYVSLDSQFKSMLGCDPPGLFRRVLVSCSGVLPQKIDNTMVYSGIPSEIGEGILGLLYG